MLYGNHDLGKYSIHNKGTVEEITSLIESNGIYMSNDEITLIGRSDYSLHDRKEMSSYELNNSTYNIVLDHQPRELENVLITMLICICRDILMLDKSFHYIMIMSF